VHLPCASSHRISCPSRPSNLLQQNSMDNHIPQRKWSGNSSTITMDLCIPGKDPIHVNQMGAEFLIINPSKVYIPPCEATVEMTVDGRPHLIPVWLPEGIVKRQRTVKIEPRA
jgi:hypothetical protein